MTSKGIPTEYALSRRGSGPAAIVTGPDDTMWITELGPAGNRIARIVPP